MPVKIDMSKFDGPWEEFVRRTQVLPRVLQNEAAILIERVFKATAPYKTGALKSSIRPEFRGDRIIVSPHVEYARRVQERGRSAGYVERAEMAARPLLQPVLEARAKEYIEEGI